MRTAPAASGRARLPGGLFRSEDGGDSWQLMRSLWDRPERKQWSGGGADLPGIHSVVVDPRDSRHVALGVSTGGVWITDDDGETWQLGGKGLRAEYLPPENAGELVRQDVHRVVTCAAQPDVLWLQHHNGIFRSEDFGLTWKEITNVAPSAFGFTVAAHPRRPGTAWFVPAIKDEQRIPAEGGWQHHRQPLRQRRRRRDLADRVQPPAAHLLRPLRDARVGPAPSTTNRRIHRAGTDLD